MARPNRDWSAVQRLGSLVEFDSRPLVRWLSVSATNEYIVQLHIEAMYELLTFGCVYNVAPGTAIAASANKPHL
jgi:hypothetical protein